MKFKHVKKGEIYYADLGNGIGSEQNGIRPIIIIQNDVGNKFSPTTIVASITTQEKKMNMKTHVVLNENCGLPEKSVATLEQIRTIDKTRLKEKVGYCDKYTMKKINNAIEISFFLTDDNLKDGR